MKSLTCGLSPSAEDEAYTLLLRDEFSPPTDGLFRSPLLFVFFQLLAKQRPTPFYKPSYQTTH